MLSEYAGDAVFYYSDQNEMDGVRISGVGDLQYDNVRLAGQDRDHYVAAKLCHFLFLDKGLPENVAGRNTPEKSLPRTDEDKSVAGKA